MHDEINLTHAQEHVQAAVHALRAFNEDVREPGAKMADLPGTCGMLLRGMAGELTAVTNEALRVLDGMQAAG